MYGVYYQVVRVSGYYLQGTDLTGSCTSYIVPLADPIFRFIIWFDTANSQGNYMHTPYSVLRVSHQWASVPGQPCSWLANFCRHHVHPSSGQSDKERRSLLDTIPLGCHDQQTHSTYLVAIFFLGRSHFPKDPIWDLTDQWHHLSPLGISLYFSTDTGNMRTRKFHFTHRETHKEKRKFKVDSTQGSIG